MRNEGTVIPLFGMCAVGTRCGCPNLHCAASTSVQFCMDKHVEADAGVGAIETLNEVTLGQGRSLTRY